MIYTHAQLERLWVQAGGPAPEADTAAAIAQAESAGRPDVVNSIGAAGLWQIYGKPFPGNATDPLTNARMAVAKYKAAGNKFTPWTTYTGADTGPGGRPGPKTYTRYLTGGQPPASSSPSPGAQQTAAATSGSSLFADMTRGLKYATVWVIVAIAALVTLGIGVNRTLGGAPARVARRAGRDGAAAAVIA